MLKAATLTCNSCGFQWPKKQRILTPKGNVRTLKCPKCRYTGWSCRWEYR